MTSFTYVIGGNVIQSANVSYASLEISANTQLAWPTQFQDVLDVVYAIMDVTPTTGGLTLFLPNATLTSVGQTLLITNPSGTNFTLSTFGSSPITFPINAGTSQFFYLTDNTTEGGTWRDVPFGGGVVAVTSVAAVSGSNNLTITGSPITSAGTFTFNFALDLAQLSGFGASTGIAARTAANTWALRAITGTANQITVTNGAGIAGNPTISLPTIITGINNLTVADLNFANNVISTTVLNQELKLVPNGVGHVWIQGGGLDIRSGLPLTFYGNNNANFLSLQGGARTTNLALTLPTTDPLNDQVLIYVGAGALGWATITTFGGPSTVNAIARYADINGTLTNSGVLIDNFNNVTGVNSLIVRNLEFGVASATDIATTAGNLTLSPNGASTVQVNSGLQVRNGGIFSLYEPGPGTNFTSFVCPALGVDIPYILPATPPSLNQIPYITSTGGGNYTWQWNNAPSGKNLLLNGALNVWQRNTSFTSATARYPNNDNTYTADGWKLLSDGNNIVNVTRNSSNFTNTLASSSFALRSTVQTANTKWGYVNYWTSFDTRMIADRTVTFQVWNSTSGVTNLKAALIAWTGAADAPTSDVVSTWNAANTPPTLVANWAYIGTPTDLNVAAPFTQTISVPITVNTALINNLAFFIWCDSTTSIINSTWEFTCAKVEYGNVATSFIELPWYEELQKSKFFFQKDLDYSEAVGGINSASYYEVSPITLSITTGLAYAAVELEKEVFRTPTVTTYGYNVATDNIWADLASGVNFAANSAGVVVDSTTKKRFVVYNNSGAPLVPTVTGTVIGHYIVEAGFNV